MGSEGNFTYSFFRINKESGDIALAAQKFKSLRLKALQAAPSSFSSTFEIESAYKDSHWIAALQDNKETFICGATPVDTDGSNPETEWIGQLSIRGPSSAEDFALPAEAYNYQQQQIDAIAAADERWQLLSMFVFPEHRGRGLAKKLCRVALDYIKSRIPEGKERTGSACVRLMVKPENQIVVSMYRQLDFAQVGLCTLAEALTANGDKEQLPSDISDAKWSARSGFIMVSHLTR